MLEVTLNNPALGSSSCDEPSVFFEDDDARYWFLYPFFESVQDRTQQMVDLYGHACFKGNSREVVLELLGQALDTALRQPERWLICIGRQSNGPLPGPVFVEIERSNLLDLIGQLQAMVQTAIDSDADVFFVGD